VRVLELSYELMVMVTGILIYGISLIPAYALIRWAYGLGFPYVVFAYPAGFYLFLFSLILTAGTVKALLVPKLKPGTYKFSKDKHVYTWFLNRTLTEFVLVPFHRFIFLNDYMRYLCLRLFGVKLHYSSVISSSYISDFGLLSFGKNTLIGGWAVIYGHVESEPGTLILAPVSIGDNTIIGGRANIGCGTTIGDNNIVGYGTVTGVYCKIGNNCNIGAMTTLTHRVLVEDDVKIGKSCFIGTGVKIRKGVKLPDFSMVPDFTTLTPGDSLTGFRLARLSDVGSGIPPRA
jgi:carbonic anhydrase/acetyltransferase-like protein (isoleucine patch superfamily)